MSGICWVICWVIVSGIPSLFWYSVTETTCLLA
jgi:hypothetical protein